MGLLLLSASPALALTGNARWESPYAERGVYAANWVYLWNVGTGDRHVSSIYAHHQDCNFYPNDGYYDDVTHNYIHCEAGLVKSPGMLARGFWQYNRTPDKFYDWDQFEVAEISTTDHYEYFEINNWDMQNDTHDNWKMAWNGQVIKTVYMPMTHAKGLISTERGLPAGDLRSSFRYLKIKSNAGTWSYWNNCQVMAEGIDFDPDKWGYYSASHWYHTN